MNCLDVLAQQIVAMTAMEDWPVDDLYRLVRQAYPYRDLTPAAFDAVLEMVSGRYRFDAERRGSRGTVARTQQLTALQPRISWDRVHNACKRCPAASASRSSTAARFPTPDSTPSTRRSGLRIGEVDEEFVYERRVGDTFLLGTNAWRIDRIDTDRVLVRPAEGTPAMAPFWRGESTGRTYDLGLAPGRVPARADASGSTNPTASIGCSATIFSTLPPPATCATTCAASTIAPAACRPIARCRSRRRAIRSATGR